ncbi:uncharacterized protein LOC105829396 isoform X2 [Monomorium pharaonis]|uniref:uncharacterized protein LOC105829396 isoform X2 n=1 Tax=Monomorium pharaonis TaxID=307658 RepID=UPI001747B009|nr:uncharacterized protein LOC105829396 isoform X2 [Monomorium pharaonis]
MRLGRDTRPGRGATLPRREATASTGREDTTPRGHGRSSCRKSTTNTRINASSHKATKKTIVMDANSKRKNNKNTKACLKSQQLENIKLEDDNKLEEVFPWLSKFNKDIRSCAGSRSYQHLKQLLSLYIQNIVSSIAENKVKFCDEINLKNHINKMLIFFHLYWLDIKQDITDHSQYLNKISALLYVYIDMELKTSTEEKVSSHVRDSSKIAAKKILAALYIYLNNSEEHIFRVLLRLKYTNIQTEEYTNICNHIFMKSFTNLKTKTTSITDVTYIRYLLAFRMWRKMQETTKKNSILKKFMLSGKKEEINKLALMLLGPRMPELQDELLKFVPRPPTNQVTTDPETLWLIQSNLFDEEQVHKKFLLFEDEMDNSTGLQCAKTIHADQSCSKIQKHQMNSLFRRSNSNGDTSQQKINKCLNVLQNNNNTLSNNKNTSLDHTYLQKKGSKSLKSFKKIRKKSKKTIIIDLTGDDEKSITCKVKRKRTKQNSKCLFLMKNIMRSNKHVNPLKYSGKSVNAGVNECPNDNKNLEEKIRSEYKLVYDVKISDTENCTSISTKSSLNDVCHINLKRNEQLNVIKNRLSNTCVEFVQKDEKQHDYNLHYLKSPMFADQNTKEFKATANVLKESKLENCVSSYVTIGNATNSYDNSITQDKKALTSQEESAMETISLIKTCQNNIADQHSFKQELPTSTDCGAMQKSHKYNCNTMPDVHDIIIKKLKSINDHSSQITEIIKQEACHQVNECPNCYTKIDCKPFRFMNNDISAAKAQGTLHNTFNDNENDIKLACDTNIIYTLRDCNKCVYVGNHIDKRVMLYAEKRMQCLNNSNDVCTVSTTFTGDEIVKSSLDSQHINFDNRRKYDYEDALKYSKNDTMKEQGRSDCDTSMLNESLHSSELCTFDIDSFEIDSKEASEIMKTDYISDFENISFSHNIQTETLEDILSNDTTNFLPLKQSLFELDNVYTDTSVNKKNVLCNNQNDVIDSSVDLVASHLNADNTFLRLPAKSDKPMFQEAMEFRYSS